MYLSQLIGRAFLSSVVFGTTSPHSHIIIGGIFSGKKMRLLGHEILLRLH